MRERLPDRRPCERFDYIFNGRKYYYTEGYYPGGKLGEVFLSCDKLGSEAYIAARNEAILASHLLQNGYSLQQIRQALLSGPNGEAADALSKAIDIRGVE